jgi:hypothetical protein
MSQAKFAAARELIEERHYTAARAVLETIDDPKAHIWLNKLSEIDQRPRMSRRRGLVIGFTVGIAMIGISYLLLIYGMPIIADLLPTSTPTRTPTAIYLTSTPDLSMFPPGIIVTQSP